MQARIAIDLIDPNPNQPRKLFDATALQELATSIKANKLLQPITVRPKGDGRYEIVMGERRWRAHGLLVQQGSDAHRTILANVRKMDDEQMAIEAIVENLARADVTPLEEAKAFQSMVDMGWTEESLALRLGVAAYRVRERLALNRLDAGIAKLVSTGQVAPTAGVEIAKLPNHEQVRVLKLISSGRLSTIGDIRKAVQAVEDRISQADIFGDAAPAASEHDVRTVNSMEAKIERLADLVAAGWKDGECRVASKVSPDRARLMADRLAAIRTAINTMERELRGAAAQVDIVLSA